MEHEFKKGSDQRKIYEAFKGRDQLQATDLWNLGFRPTLRGLAKINLLIYFINKKIAPDKIDVDVPGSSTIRGGSLPILRYNKNS